MTGPHLLDDLSMPDRPGLADRSRPAVAPWLVVHAATTVEAGAATLLAGLAELGLGGCTLGWSSEWPEAIGRLSPCRHQPRRWQSRAV
jgi:hypothetical protein